MCLSVISCYVLQTMHFIRRVINPACVILYNSDVNIIRIITTPAGAEFLPFIS